MVCIKCRKIQDFYWSALDEMEVPEEAKGWGEIRGKHLELRGICQECLKDENKGGAN
jgi:Fur family peroxide stress response transcriptional regulator